MDKAAQNRLIRSFERHLRAENRSERTIATYLIGLCQDDAFLHAHGTILEAATRLPDAAQEAADRAGQAGPQRAPEVTGWVTLDTFPALRKVSLNRLCSPSEPRPGGATPGRSWQCRLTSCCCKR